MPSTNKPSPSRVTIVPVEEIPKAVDVDLNDPVSVYKICKEMEKVCIDSAGLGLAAVQVGIPLKLFIVRFDDGFRYFVNCSYTSTEKKVTQSIEGCLSIRGKTFLVLRHPSITLTGYELIVRNSDPIFIPINEFHDKNHIVFQHEIDHHLDILISDIGREVQLRKNDF